MRRFGIFLCLAIVWPFLTPQAQDLSALARVMPDQSQLIKDGADVVLTLNLNQGVPFRVFTLGAPYRLVLDFNEIDWTGLDPDTLNKAQAVGAVRVGVFRPGWSRMVMDLDGPFSVHTAAMQTSDAGTARVLVRLAPTSKGQFLARAGAPADDLYRQFGQGVDLPEPKSRQTGEAPLVVVLDPGHGGIDPGAERGDISEANLMLAFARELQETLLRAGNFDVVLTRREDVFVPLEARVSIARQAGADVFLSLHADAIAEGRASGATIYTLSDEATDVASQKLAERHDRADLLAGLDLSQQDDVIASVLMDMARLETTPRSDSLADALVVGLSDTVGMHKRPRLSAGFSVLKAPDIPSVLIELGFLSSPRDLNRIRDPEWRAAAAQGIRDALIAWAISDAAEAQLLRQ